MIYTIKPPSNIKCEINLPASKSISNRVLIINALSKSPFEIENLSECDDTKIISHAIKNKDININVGAAGTSMRFLTAYFSQIKGTKIITGIHSVENNMTMGMFAIEVAGNNVLRVLNFHLLHVFPCQFYHKRIGQFCSIAFGIGERNMPNTFGKIRIHQALHVKAVDNRICVC
jgi:hypothetical protein